MSCDRRTCGRGCCARGVDKCVTPPAESKRKRSSEPSASSEIGDGATDNAVRIGRSADDAAVLADDLGPRSLGRLSKLTTHVSSCSPIIENVAWLLVMALMALLCGPCVSPVAARAHAFIQVKDAKDAKRANAENAALLSEPHDGERVQLYGTTLHQSAQGGIRV